MPGRTGGTLPELSPTMEAVSVELASGQGRGLRVLVHLSGQCCRSKSYPFRTFVLGRVVS